MHRIDHATAAPGSQFTDGDPLTATPATVVTPEWLNDVQGNLAAAIEAAGIVLSKSDFTQLSAALLKITRGAHFGIASAAGTADAITADFNPDVDTLTDGMVLFVRAATANLTPTPTFTPNSGVIAAKTIVKGAGAPLVPGDIAGAGHWIEFRYDLTLDKWVQANPATGVVTAVRLPDFTGSNQSLATNGYQKLPGGLIVQWGYLSNSNSTGTVTFPIAFPTACLDVLTTLLIAGATTHVSNVSSKSTTQFGYGKSLSSSDVMWFALGY